MTENGLKILLIEDEESLSNVIALNLKLEGFEVITVLNGREALSYTERLGTFDLVILDVMLPEISGWDICSTFKRVASTPILFISAKGSSLDKIKGLKLGADDYLAKPFDLEELLLRVQILISRNRKESSVENKLQIGSFDVDLNTYEVKQEGKLIASLTKRDVQLLQLFKKNEGKVLSRDFILDELWGRELEITTRTIDNYILSFRKLFEKDVKNPHYFHSIRGVGYKFLNN
ncbi:MAG: response regulator transcription factor [Brumimicrobium sp.]|nr:response regulator transcription factor [Brumimicrobium sp.]MCO5267423.1 response regulator transcription factor [Brumimicrobium sp.]